MIVMMVMMVMMTASEDYMHSLPPYLPTSHSWIIWTLQQDKLDRLDTQAIAYIFSDRLEVHPARNWHDFLCAGELLPQVMR
jgi:hypothetical protein